MNNIVLSDLDETLLYDHNTLTKHTIDTINQFIEDGGIFIPCTARTYTALPTQLRDLNIRYVVCANGAIIYDIIEQKVVKSYPLAIDVVQGILKDLDTDRFYTTFVSNGELISEKGLLKIMQNLWGLSKEQIDEIQTKRLFLDDVFSKLNTNDTVDKLLFSFETIEDREYVEQTIKMTGEFQALSSSEYNLEFTNIKSDKGLAGKEVAQLLGSDDYTLYAFGDNYNDVPMFKVADVGVAMLNAHPNVQKLAHTVSDHTNKEDGVANYILKYIMV